MAIRFVNDDSPTVNITTDVDDDGDVVVHANGYRICYIDSDDGKLYLDDRVPTTLGFALDSRGRITIGS